MIDLSTYKKKPGIGGLVGWYVSKNICYIVVSTIFLFSPLLGEMIRFDKHIFEMGWNHQLISYTSFTNAMLPLRFQIFFEHFVNDWKPPGFANGAPEEVSSFLVEYYPPPPKKNSGWDRCLPFLFEMAPFLGDRFVSGGYCFAYPCFGV